jgi:hypothetical protein
VRKNFLSFDFFLLLVVVAERCLGTESFLWDPNVTKRSLSVILELDPVWMARQQGHRHRLFSSCCFFFSLFAFAMIFSYTETGFEGLLWWRKVSLRRGYSRIWSE